MIDFRSACASVAFMAAFGVFVAPAPASAQSRAWGEKDIRGGDSYPLHGASEETETRDLPPLTRLRASRARERVKPQETVRKQKDETKGVDLSAIDAATKWTPGMSGDTSLRDGILDAFRRDDPQFGLTSDRLATMETKQFDTIGDRKAQIAIRLHGRDGDDIRLLWFDASQHWRLGPSVGPAPVFQRIQAGIRPGFFGAAEHAPKNAVMVDGAQLAQRPKAAWIPVSGAYIGGRPRQPTKADIGVAQLLEPGVATNSGQQNAWNNDARGRCSRRMFPSRRRKRRRPIFTFATRRFARITGRCVLLFFMAIRIMAAPCCFPARRRPGFICSVSRARCVPPAPRKRTMVQMESRTCPNQRRSVSTVSRRMAGFS